MLSVVVFVSDDKFKIGRSRVMREKQIRGSFMSAVKRLFLGFGLKVCCCLCKKYFFMFNFHLGFDEQSINEFSR